MNQLDVGMLVIETAFSHDHRELAERCLHLSPVVLVEELAQIAPGRHYPIYITHTKPSNAEKIMRQIDALATERERAGWPRWDIRELRAGALLAL